LWFNEFRHEFWPVAGNKFVQRQLFQGILRETK
jgi:hypothetical protein